MSNCFHCGEVITQGFATKINDKDVSMCCLGCKEVAKTIIASGLGDYYKYRTEFAKKYEVIPDILVKNKIYDLDDINQDFLYADDNNLNKVNLMFEDITCAACAWLIEHKLKSIPGIIKINVNATTKRAMVSFDKSKIMLSEILDNIYKIGYKAAPYQVNLEDLKTKQEYKKTLFALALSGFAMMQVTMFALVLYTGYFSDLQESFRDYFRIVSLIFATPVVFYAAQTFYFSALRSLLNGHINMYVPVSIAILWAYVASCIATIQKTGDVYFESITMFTFFLLLGRFFEQLALVKAASSLNNTKNLIPLSAKIFKGEELIDIPVKKLVVGDRYLLKPGEVFAADGKIIQGSTSVDESMLTGESTPVVKLKEDLVFAGSINIDQPVTVEVTAVGNAQLISKIIELQEEATQNKPPIAQIANKISQYFSLVILILSLGTYITWSFIMPDHAFWVTLAVLVAACPCALALATPTAITCASATFSKLGLIIKNPNVFEVLPKINAVVFDKTGTLTYGKLKIEDVYCYSLDNNLDKEKVLKIAAALEISSTHPIARAFTIFYDKNIITSDIKHTVGLGVQGIVDGKVYKLGNFKYINYSDKKIICDPNINLFLTENDKLIAGFTLSDTIRIDAKPLIDKLKNLNLSIASGDTLTKVKQVGDILNINSVKANMLPIDKVNYIKEMQQKYTVAMFGDGINDVPVLGAADISIAMGDASFLTKNSADLILLNDELLNFDKGIYISQKTQKIINQNFYWAIVYNISILPLAMTGNLPPYLAALGMSLSSIVVLFNSLRLLKIRFK